MLVAGDDMNEPVADEVRSILDGHIILSRELAAQGHYPAVNVSHSVSRVMDSIVDDEHKMAARKLREVLATYEKEKDLIMIGAYERGSDARVDYAIDHIDSVNDYLTQDLYEQEAFDDLVARLKGLFG